MAASRPAVLVIAGSDSSGGAGLVRDVQTLRDCATPATCALTAVTAQTYARVLTVHALPPELVAAQVSAALASQRIGAIKIGMLATAAIIEALLASLPPRSQIPIVLDPVILSSSGGALLDEEGEVALRTRLVPRVSLLTPNLSEAARLLGEPPGEDEPTLRGQAQRLLALGAEAVLLKGGHAQGPEAIDWLVLAQGSVHRLAGPRLTARLRGTGCALASSIAAHLASGDTLEEACRFGKEYVAQELRRAGV